MFNNKGYSLLLDLQIQPSGMTKFEGSLFTRPAQSPLLAYYQSGLLDRHPQMMRDLSERYELICLSVSSNKAIQSGRSSRQSKWRVSRSASVIASS